MKNLKVFSGVLILIGVAILVVVDWRLFLGLFFIRWGDNLWKHINTPEFQTKVFINDIKAMAKKQTTTSTNLEEQII